MILLSPTIVLIKCSTLKNYTLGNLVFRIFVFILQNKQNKRPDYDSTTSFSDSVQTILGNPDTFFPDPKTRNLAIRLLEKALKVGLKDSGAVDRYLNILKLYLNKKRKL